ncbi:MAG TPA: molybdenum cofactor guanylyltransferase, partial [Terriglobia bacterium]|nr:molybdenum cofactor guanylyltransferase [Terriglobia bacterium]
DNATMEFQGHTLLEHMVRLVSTAASPVRIVGRGNLTDKVPGCGPLGGIHTALDVTESESNLFVAVDLPLLTPEFLKWFCEHLIATSKQLVACRIGNDFPLCLGIRRTVRSEVSRRIDDSNLALHRFIREMDSDILSELEIQTAGFPSSMFHNLNTPDDWQRL